VTWYGAPVKTTTGIPVYQQLFLLSHDPDGATRLAPPVMSVALAGATMVELALSECLRVEADRIYVYSAAPIHSDPLAAATITALLRVDGPKQLSHWLRVLAADSYDRVSGGLLAAGLVRRETSRQKVRYLHTDVTVAQQCLGVVRESLYSRTVQTPQTLVLCGFFSLLRLHAHLHINLSGRELLDALDGLFRMVDPRVRDIVNQTGQLITEAGIRAYR
jgi:Golgi phosphoprotein 3 (GPP34)